MQTFHIKPGHVLGDGRYLVQKRLSYGASAIVWKALDRHLQVSVALKAILFVSGDTKKEHLMKQARAEVNTASSINHCRIAKLIDVLVENRYLIEVWELIEGKDMLGVVNSFCSHRLPEDMAAHFFHQLLDGVTYLHQSGFCHRDIKLENCMISRNMLHLKLIDFGMSKNLESVCTLNTGTPNYMAPEILTSVARRKKSDGPLYDGRAVDCWAMGVILYVMVTGKYPFENSDRESTLSTIQNITSGRMRPLPTYISQGCSDLVLSLLELNPKNRSTLKDVSRNKWLLRNSTAYVIRHHLEKLRDLNNNDQQENQGVKS